MLSGLQQTSSNGKQYCKLPNTHLIIPLPRSSIGVAESRKQQ